MCIYNFKMFVTTAVVASLAGDANCDGASNLIFSWCNCGLKWYQYSLLPSFRLLFGLSVKHFATRFRSYWITQNCYFILDERFNGYENVFFLCFSDDLEIEPLIEPNSGNDFESSEPVYGNVGVCTVIPVKVEDLWDYVKANKTSECEGFRREYRVSYVVVRHNCYVFLCKV